MGPFKCPDCGVWWAGYEHRCQPGKKSTRVTVRPAVVSTTVRCTCHDLSGNTVPTAKAWCPVHDVQVTYTSSQVRYA